VDEELYVYKKAVAEQAARLSALLTGLDDKATKLNKVLLYLKDLDEDAWSNLPASIEDMLTKIRDTRAFGQTPRPTERQVGAWQSYRITAHSKIGEAQQKAMSRMTVPSIQDWETVEQAKGLIDDFEVAVRGFMRDAWGPFVTKLEKAGLLPGVE
jgi:hypothetical protein